MTHHLQWIGDAFLFLSEKLMAGVAEVHFVRLYCEPIRIEMWRTAIWAEKTDNRASQKPADVVSDRGLGGDEDTLLVEEVAAHLELDCIEGLVDDLLATWLLASVDVNSALGGFVGGVVDRLDRTP